MARLTAIVCVGFTRAIGPEQSEELAGWDIEVDPAQRDRAVAIGLAEVSNFQRLHDGNYSGPSLYVVRDGFSETVG